MGPWDSTLLTDAPGAVSAACDGGTHMDRVAGLETNGGALALA
jgi:hypothetical protein